MTHPMKRIGRRFGPVLLTALFTVLGAGQAALAQDKPSAPVAAPPAKDFKDERALTVLKRMSETLAGARTLSFKVRGIVPTPAPTGQFVSLFASSSVTTQRPDKLFVAARGDLFPSDIYYNGKTVTVVSADRRFYTQRDASGSAMETLMQNMASGADATGPFLDLLAADPYAVLTQDFTSALWVGQSTVAGVATDHLAFTAEGLDWEIWIGARDKLPRLMVVSYRTGPRQPTFTAELSGWKLNAAVAPSTFNADIPKGAVKLEFKQFGQGK